MHPCIDEKKLCRVMEVFSSDGKANWNVMMAIKLQCRFRDIPRLWRRGLSSKIAGLRTFVQGRVSIFMNRWEGTHEL